MTRQILLTLAMLFALWLVTWNCVPRDIVTMPSGDQWQCWRVLWEAKCYPVWK